jgi:hypothetical protein
LVKKGENVMPKLSVTLIDAFGRTTNRRYEIEEQATLVDYNDAVTAFIARLGAVTTLGVVKADLLIPQTGFASSAAAGANVDVGATFVGWIEDGAGKKASHKVPGIDQTLVDGDGSIDLTGVVATYLGSFVGTEPWLLSDGEQISSWIDGILDK